MSQAKIVVVTGASRGLGFQVARLLAARGDHVYAVARTVGGLEELDDTIAAQGGTRPTLLPLDVTDDAGVDRLGATLFERHARLDAFVHCAAHAAPLSPVGHVAAKDLDRSLAVNARAVQRLIRSLDPLLMQSGAGKAVFMEDQRVGAPYWSAYAATREAGLGFARAYAAERAKSPLRVLFHAPPSMPTALRARFYPSEDRNVLTPCAEAAADVVALL